MAFETDVWQGPKYPLRRGSQLRLGKITAGGPLSKTLIIARALKRLGHLC